jgi:outer membrane protein assembly factor BamA
LGNTWYLKTTMASPRPDWLNTCLRSALAAICLSLFAIPARAQDSRAGEIEDQIAEKAKQLQPYQPGKLEKLMLAIEENRILGRLSPEVDGWYPKLGGMTTGSGFAAGPGYRRHFGRDGVFDVSMAVSIKNYRLAEAKLQSPAFAGRLLAVETHLRYRHYPQERFFGLGLDSQPDQRVSYLFEDVTGYGGLLIGPHSPFRAGIRAGYTNIENAEGSGRRFPSVETLFNASTAPALFEQPDYRFGEAYAEINYLDFPGNPRSGGRYRASLTSYDDRNLDRFSFRRVDVEALQLIPFFDKRRVIALRALGAFAKPRDGHQVPFYLMPFIGGPETLRGFRERRFTDENALLFNIEYRYEIFAALDMAVFYDAGTVAREREGLSLGDMKTNYGLGFRFGTRASTIMRFDIGLGSGEGVRYFLKFGPVF